MTVPLSVVEYSRGISSATPDAPCPSGKRRHDTLWRAKLALVGCRLAGAAGDDDRREVATYLCPLCRGWHLVGWPSVLRTGRPTLAETTPRRGAGETSA